MKPTIYLPGLLFVLTLFSCKKNLDLTPTTFYPTNITSAAQMQNQLAAAYNSLEQDALYAQGLWGYLEAGADESFRNGAVSTTALTEYYNILNTEPNVQLFWRNCYRGIEYVNVILDGIDGISMDSTTKKNIEGQVIFLRAFYFYLLVSNFGDVPLKTTVSSEMGTDFNLPRTAAKDVYAFILSEMTRAEPMVQTMAQAGSPTIVTQSAVDAILARVCLTMAGNPINDPTQYAAALGWAQRLINSGVHSLNATPLSQYPNTPAYARVFINNMQDNMNDPNTTEGIWDAAFLSKSNTSGTYTATAYLVLQQLGALMGVYCPDASTTALIGYSSGTYRVFPKLYNLYGPGDLRRDWIAAPYSYKNTTTTQYPYLAVTISGGGGAGATATAHTSNTGALTSIEVDNPGSGYTSAPTIAFTAYFNSTVNPPAVPPQAVTIPANIAAATATVSGGQVTSISVTAPGLGYPTVCDRPVGKWRREYEIDLPPVRQQNYTSCNFPIVRYADVLLMAAEADLKVNGTPSATAVGYFNQVRRRAYGYSPTAPAPVPGVDYTTFTMQDIMDERSRELCFEGVRRQDLIRWGSMQTVMQNLLTDNGVNVPTSYLTSANTAATDFLANPAKYELFPIPGSEILLDNALTQNPGW
jgi:hypothetical protein